MNKVPKERRSRTAREREQRTSKSSARPAGRSPGGHGGEGFERGAALIVALVSLLVVVTCSASARPPELSPTPSGPPVSGRAQQAPTAPAPVPVAPMQGAHEPESNRVVPSAPTPLGSFYTGLRALSDGQRNRHVRITWLGDSHTTADLWTHEVRRRLQARFGIGGPGFVHVGLKRFRHSQVKTDVIGKWQQSPGQPARTQPFLDGIFGLGGVRAAAKDRAIARVRPYQSAFSGLATWRIFYRTPAGASFRVELGQYAQTLKSDRRSTSPEPGGASDIHAIHQLQLEAAAGDELLLRQVSGRPEFFGVVIEAKQPGVVLDTLGIDGARARTPLAWQAEAWERELARRGADLVVLAYGTNEVFEAHAAASYQQHFLDLMARVRRVVPDVACFIIGPTDVLQGEGRSHPRVMEISRVQRSSAEALGCEYVGAHELMGGEGSYAEWQTSRPQLAGNDGVHLTVRGYQELGELTGDYLVTGYENWLRAQPPMVSAHE